MSPFFAVFFVVLLGSSSYAAGRLHGQLSYRIGYRVGYRQGYLDGDRGAWNRRRREVQSGRSPADGKPPARSVVVRQGTTYTSTSFVGAVSNGGRHSTRVG